MPQRESTGCLGFVFRLFGVTAGDGSRGGTSGRAEALPYRRKDWLLTKAERSFFGALERAVGDDYRIFAKVRLADLFWIPRGTDRRQTHLNRVSAKHIDFVLCSRDEVRPVLAIELDDSSHERDSRRARDRFVDDAMAAAGLPLLRVRAREAYSVEELAEKVRAAGPVRIR